MDFKKIMTYGLILYIVLSLILLVAGVTASKKQTFTELGALALVNVLSSVFGLVRILMVKPAQTNIKEKIGKIAAEHSWLTFSVTTAVLSLAFGSYFIDNATTMIIQYVFLSAITLLSIYMIVEVARNKITFLD